VVKSRPRVYNFPMPRSKKKLPPGKIETLTVEETNAILKASSDPRITALIMVFLNAGLYLKEAVCLTVDSLDWAEHALHVSGDRERTIKLDDQAYEALAAYSRERPAVRHNAFFLASKGPRQGLSDIAIDHILRFHGRRAGLRCALNAKILRDTFALRLLSQKDHSIAEAARLLGFTSVESLDRYIKAAQLPPLDIPARLDRRSPIQRAISRAFPVKPKVARPTANDPPVTQGDILFGRESVITGIRSDIARRNSVLLTGPLGIGKTELLNYLAKLYPEALKIDAPVPVRAVLGQVLNRISPKKKLQANEYIRIPNAELLAQIAAAGKSDLLLLIDNLERVKAPEADIFARLLDNFTVVAATSATPERLQQLWYKFRLAPLANLRPETARQMVRHLTADLPVDDREMLETRIISLANGLPLAIVGMVRQLRHEPVIDRDAIRGVYHEAGVRYRDWTPFLIILWGVAMASRFIALGTHSFEGYILAGVGMAALMTTVRFLRMVK
jgi:AraC-like DNA-binding protein